MLESVKANIRYLRPEWRGRSELPNISSRDTRRANTQFYDVDIANARPLKERGELSLDTNGFVLAPHRTRVANFHDAAQITQTYYAEIKALIKALTHADDVVILHHVIRTEDTSGFNTAYARFVHCDFSAARARDISRELMVQSGICTATEAEQYDFAWYNTWQPIDREVQRNPLTLLDARTMEKEDLVEYTFGGSGIFEVASMPFYSSKHRHYYFPRMQTDELIVIKQLDSRRGRTSQCPHTSFDDTTSPPDALPRHSIEVRMMCVFARHELGASTA